LVPIFTFGLAVSHLWKPSTSTTDPYDSNLNACQFVHNICTATGIWKCDLCKMSTCPTTLRTIWRHVGGTQVFVEPAFNFFRPLTTMDGPRNGLPVIAKHLTSVTFSSKPAVEIDSILVTGLFGQRTKKKGKRSHNMQTLSTACSVDDDTRDGIYATFQENKDKLCFQSPQTYLACAYQMAKSIHEGSRLLATQGARSLAIIEW
jgi:hypothetical protein